ncbi:MAG: GNAT family N-acetyltransferase [Oscillospiraceae bacterium]|nr:GNAT family N-acetyltransferase [Oscillospiraceae bacterium]
MLIRWATENDLPAWCALATEVSPIFRHPADMGADPEFTSYAQSKVNKYEALTAVDYMSGSNIGFIGFSRTNNRITWFGVSEKYRGKGVGSRLLKTALRQLDHTKPITVETYPEGYEPGIPAKNLYRKFGFAETESNLVGPHNLPICQMTVDLFAEKRGGSFHYRYPDFIKAAQKENCPVCNHEPMPDGQIDILVTDKICVGGEYPGQGRLFGKLYVMPIEHYFHFEDMPQADAAFFMGEVQRVGKALRKVTGAEKINYETHANSGAHLHIHLFPRYLDDDFPSAPIDYRVSEPAPYENYEEYLWFIEQMKAGLGDSPTIEN